MQMVGRELILNATVVTTLGSTSAITLLSSGCTLQTEQSNGTV